MGFLEGSGGLRLQRTATLIAAVSILVAAVPSVAAGQPNLATTTQQASSTCDGGLGPLPPPPNPLKQKAPSLSGRVDLPVPFTPGVVRFRIRCGRDIGDVTRRHGTPGQARNWSPGPFDAHDIRAGIDRSFAITVRSGQEKAWVQRLAAHNDAFEWVQLDWQFPVAVSGEPGRPSTRPLTLDVTDPYFTGTTPLQTNLTRVNIKQAWDRTTSFDAIVVAVIDSGLNAIHQDAGQWKQKKGFDYVQGIETPAGTAVDSGCNGGHGTHVGTIAAGDTNNAKGIAGAGFNSGILPMRALHGATATSGHPRRATGPSAGHG